MHKRLPCMQLRLPCNGRELHWLPCPMQLLGEDAAKTTNFAAYLREVFHPTTEPVTMEVPPTPWATWSAAAGPLQPTLLRQRCP